MVSEVWSIAVDLCFFCLVYSKNIDEKTLPATHVFITYANKIIDLLSKPQIDQVSSVSHIPQRNTVHGRRRSPWRATKQQRPSIPRSRRKSFRKSRRKYSRKSVRRRTRKKMKRSHSRSSRKRPRRPMKSYVKSKKKSVRKR